MYSEVFPSRLKYARKVYSFTQAEVANILSITQQVYSSYERGTSQPNLERLALIAKLFNVSTDWLVGLSSQESEFLKNFQREKMLRKLEIEADIKKRLFEGQ